MGRRHQLSRRSSERSFTHNARRVHPKNALPLSGPVMRGGIRL